jgi:hypothetical protein
VERPTPSLLAVLWDRMNCAVEGGLHQSFTAESTITNVFPRFVCIENPRQSTPAGAMMERPGSSKRRLRAFEPAAQLIA